MASADQDFWPQSADLLTVLVWAGEYTQQSLPAKEGLLDDRIAVLVLRFEGFTQLYSPVGLDLKLAKQTLKIP